jgi:hypothetical protein
MSPAITYWLHPAPRRGGREPSLLLTATIIEVKSGDKLGSVWNFEIWPDLAPPPVLI